MNSKFIYQDVIEHIQDICDNHIKGQASADELQYAVQLGEAAIVAIEERDVRDFLTDIEGQLELIKFTVEAAEQSRRTRAVAEHIISWLNTYHHRGND